MRGGPIQHLPSFPGIEAVFGENPARFLHPGLDVGAKPLIDGMEDVSRVDAWLHVERSAYGRPKILAALKARRRELTGDVDQSDVEMIEAVGPVVEVKNQGEGESVDDSADDQDPDVDDVETEPETVTVAIGDLPGPGREYVSKEARMREGDDVYRNASMFSTADCRERLLAEFAKGVEREPHIIDALADRLRDDGGEVPGDDVTVEMPVSKMGDAVAGRDDEDEGEEGESDVEHERVLGDETASGSESESESDAHDTGSLLMGAMG